ncbi:MAG: type II secretion system F family protein [Myxococcota bacterium]
MTIGMILMLGFIMLVGAIGGTAGILMLAGGGKKSSGDRLRDLTAGTSRTEMEAAREARVAEALAERLAKLATPSDEEQQNLLRQKLLHAGYRNRNAAEVFNGIRVALVFLLPIVTLPLLSRFSIWYMVGGTVLAAIVGYMLPMYLVNRRIDARHRKLLGPFPDALDLLVTSVEAGLALDMAFRRVADEIRSAAPELALEFQLVNHEVSTGIPRLEAFRHLAERTGLDEVKSLVNMMIQAERFGTSIAAALRIHGDMVRQKRMARAEEEAAKVSPKLTIIMILFLMPSLVIVLMGPAIIKVREALVSE